LADSTHEIELGEQDELYKRLAPPLCDRAGNATSGVYKVNGKPDPQPSVDLARLTTLADVLARGKPGFGVGVITVKAVKSVGFQVVHMPENGNDAHCILVGENSIEKARALAAQTITLILPTPIGKPV
jgi:hypothetical protein